MRTVKSVSDLQRIAFGTGATVRVDGRPINASGAKVSIVPPKPAPEPAPKVEPPAAPQPDVRPEVYALMAEQARDQARLTETLMQTLAMREPAPRTPWRFEVKYDREGRITEVLANPEPPLDA